MPDKHPNSHRWGGPGASHEDASKPMPDQGQPRPDDAVGSRPNVSQVSGGGGERDEKHSHVDDMRSSKSHATDSPSPTSTRDWRKNRSRASQEREAQAEAETAGEPKSFADEAPDLEILVNTDDNVEGRQGLLDHVGQQIGEALRRFEGRLTRVEVHLSDLNAGKSGPSDKRCAIEARPRGLAPVATSDEAATLDAAVSGAASKMVRLLDSEFGRRGAKDRRESIRGGF